MSKRLSTQAVHGGEDKHKPHGAVTTPIYQTSTYAFQNTAEILEYMRRRQEGDPDNRDEYGRYGNPTQRIAERKLTVLESGEQTGEWRALLFSSGMAAITTTLLALLSSGDHLVMVQGCYRRTSEFAERFLSRWNIQLILAETPTNPYLRVMDLGGLAGIARQRGILSAVDSTFATPINLRPFEYGIDLVLHSATKYLGGHNDLLAGAVIGPAHLLAPIEQARGVLGGVSNPQEAYLLARGLKTLALRLRQQNENGLRVAQWLEGHPAVERVHYPGLPSHPDFALAQQQMSGFGSVVSFELKTPPCADPFAATGNFIDRLRLPYVGPTLGGVESVIEQPAALFSLDPLERRAGGIQDNLVRYAIGIEDPEDILADLAQALEAI